jgi:hypothetical protein
VQVVLVGALDLHGCDSPTRSSGRRLATVTVPSISGA